MAPPTFIVAFVWEGILNADPAAKMIELLADSLDPRTAGMTLSRRPGLAALQLNLAFSLYSRPLLQRLQDMGKAAGGHFVELLRIPMEVRQKFVTQFLTPSEGEPEAFDSFILASRAIRAHLQGGDSKAASSPAQGAAPRSTAEDRQATRYACALGVEFKSAEEFVKEYATNISKGGLFVRTKTRPLLNSEALLTLHLPDGQTLEAVVRVVHVMDHPEHGGVGLSFLPGSKGVTAKLERYLASLGTKKS